MRTKYLINATYNMHPHHPETLLDTPTSPCVHVLCQRSRKGLIIPLLNNFTSSVHTALSNAAFRFLQFLLNIISEIHLNHCCLCTFLISISLSTI